MKLKKQKKKILENEKIEKIFEVYVDMMVDSKWINVLNESYLEGEGERVWGCEGEGEGEGVRVWAIDYEPKTNWSISGLKEDKFNLLISTFASQQSTLGCQSIN